MKTIIAELERIKADAVKLFEKNEDVEHIHYLVGDVILVCEDRISECKSILKNGVIWRDEHGNPREAKPYPSKIANCDYFYGDGKRE